MEALIAALHWAVDEMEWLDSVPKIKKPKTATLRQAKGRSLATEEFERMIDKTPAVVGESAAES